MAMAWQGSGGNATRAADPPFCPNTLEIWDLA
jgi:hypothetical protein